MPTATYLENAALYYVQRYAATTTSLRRVLQKRSVFQACGLRQ
jgi:hypothetical protein